MSWAWRVEERGTPPFPGQSGLPRQKDPSEGNGCLLATPPCSPGAAESTASPLLPTRDHLALRALGSASAHPAQGWLARWMRPWVPGQPLLLPRSSSTNASTEQCPEEDHGRARMAVSKHEAGPRVHCLAPPHPYPIAGQTPWPPHTRAAPASAATDPAARWKSPSKTPDVGSREPCGYRTSVGFPMAWPNRPKASCPGHRAWSVHGEVCFAPGPAELTAGTPGAKATQVQRQELQKHVSRQMGWP